MLAAEKELDAGTLKDQPLVDAAVCETIGRTLSALGRYDAAEPNHRRALELRRRHLPAEHAEITRGMAELGLVLRYEGKLSEAEGLLREALVVRRRTMPTNAP